MLTLIAIACLVGAGVFLLRGRGPARETTAESPTSPEPTLPTQRPASVDTASIRAVQVAMTLIRSGRHDEALELLNEAIARDSSYDQLFVTQGMAYRALKEFELAATAFGKAIAVAPGASKAYLYRGIVYTDDLGLYDRGIQDFRRVLELDPGSTDAMVNIAVALHKAGRYEEAIRQYDKVIPKLPGDGRLVYLRGLAYQAKGDPDSALADMMKARSLGMSVSQALLDSLRTAADTSN